MFNLKVESKISKLLVTILLMLVVSSNSFVTFHTISHNTFISAEVTSVKAEVSHKSFFEKIIFAHQKSSDKKLEHCFLCASSNFQNQIFLPANLIFVIIAFYLVFARRYLDNVKLSYLLSSRTSRAPPVIF